MKVQIVKDEPEMMDSIRQFLKEENSIVEKARDFSNGVDKINFCDYDCILPDIMLPCGRVLELLPELSILNN